MRSRGNPRLKLRSGTALNAERKPIGSTLHLLGALKRSKSSKSKRARPDTSHAVLFKEGDLVKRGRPDLSHRKKDYSKLAGHAGPRRVGASQGANIFSLTAVELQRAGESACATCGYLAAPRPGRLPRTSRPMPQSRRLQTPSRYRKDQSRLYGYW